MPTIFYVEAPSSGRLALNSAGALHGTLGPHAADPAVLLCLSDSPSRGFMFSGSAATIRIEGSPFTEVVQPWRVRRSDGGVTLHDPANGHVLVAGEHGRLSLQAYSAENVAALFTLTPVPESALTPAMIRSAAFAQRLTPRNLNGPDILDVIARALTPETAPILQAVLRLLPRDQMEWLGGTILGLPDHLARLAAAFPADIWASRAMPELRDWLATRPGVAQLRIPPALDFLADRGLDGRQTSIAHTLNAVARAGVPPRRTVCVVATARNEGLYLLEWIAYHRKIGAEAVFIYSNDNSDFSDDLLRALALAGEITWIENNLEAGGGAQPKAYGHAFGILPQVLDFRWSLVIDLDEFFAFDAARYRSLPDYIAWQETQHVDAIALNWVVFGSAGAGGWNDAPLTERFTKRLPWIDPHIKSLSRTNICVHSRPHHASFDWLRPVVTLDSDGVVHQTKGGASFSANPRAERAWVAHYFLKSAQEFVWKFSRNRGDHALSREMNPNLIDAGFAGMFVAQHQSPTMADDRRIIACAPQLRQEIDRLRALPGVADAERRVLAAYRSGIEVLLGRMQIESEFQVPGSPYAALLQFCGR